MLDSTAKNIIHCFTDSKDAGLKAIGKHLETVTKANAQLKKILATPLADHCYAVNIRQGCLMIKTDSAAWATTIRYQLPDILQQLRQYPALAGLRSIDFYVDPATAVVPQQPALDNGLSISTKTAELLRQTAEKIVDPDLKKILLHLTTHAKEEV